MRKSTMRLGIPLAASLGLCAISAHAGGHGVQSTCHGPPAQRCIAHVTSVNVNQGDISFTTDLPAAELGKLSCVPAGPPVNFRIPRADEGNDNYQRMYEHLLLAADTGRKVDYLVDGGTFDCRARTIRVEYDADTPPGR